MAGAREGSLPWAEFAQGDIRFHEALADATKNPIRVAVMLAGHEVFRQSSATMVRHDSRTWRLEQARQLATVAAAVAAADADEARRCRAAHVEVNAATVQAIVASERVGRAVPPD